MTTSDASTVKSAERVVEVLELMAQGPLGHTEISAKLGIPKSSLTGLLRTLVQSEMVLSDPMTKHYALGPRVVTLAGRYLANLDLAVAGQPIVHDLMKETDESASLCIQSGGEILVIVRANCSQPLQRSLQLGERALISRSSAGKAILAFVSEAEQTAALRVEAKIHPAHTDLGKLQNELREIRRTGIAVSRDETIRGLTGLAAPVVDGFGNLAGALSVAIPTSRVTKQVEVSVSRALRAASKALRFRLGGPAGESRTRKPTPPSQPKSRGATNDD
jgi:DNA-binding IclR family transcriptional regulator